MQRRGRCHICSFIFTYFLFSYTIILFAQSDTPAELVVTTDGTITELRLGTSDPCLEPDADFALVITSSIPYPVWGKCCLVDCDPYVNECSVTTEKTCQNKGGYWIENAICGTCNDPC